MWHHARDRTRRRGARRGAAPLAVLCALLCAVLAGVTAAADDAEGTELYRWLDRGGVIRYTPDFSRIPDARRNTAVRVISGSTYVENEGVPMAAPAGTTIPSPGATLNQGGTAAATAPPGADPFNSPSEAHKVKSDAGSGSSWPELDARIAELEVLVAQDEEVIKEMISRPVSPDDDELIHSAKLREVAARLPILQGELMELRRWREQPDRR